MIADCFRYYKGCEECQKHGDVQLVPTALMHLIIKPWPFGGWGLDFIGKMHPSSSKGHCFVIVATDYFTKWTEVSHLLFRRKPSANLYACEDQVSCI
jgi:hypothetical protein